MRFPFSAIFGLLPLALTASASSQEFIILRSRVLPGQTGKGAYDDLYLTLHEIPFNGPLIPTFAKLSASADFFILVPSIPASGDTPALNYLNYNGTSYAPKSQFHTVMQFNFAVDALWQPVFLPSPKQGSKIPVSYQNRFYVDNSNSSTPQLLWDNDMKDELFESWLICDWYYGYKQLMFTVKTRQDFSVPKNPTLPSSCALIALDIIAIPN